MLTYGRPDTACNNFRPLSGVDVCADCRWNGAAHRDDTSEPAVTRDGATTQIIRRAPILRPDTTDMITNTPEILAAVAELEAARAAWRAARDGLTAAPVGDDGLTKVTRATRALARDLNAAEHTTSYARRLVEQSVRAANPGATEAQIRTAAGAL